MLIIIFDSGLSREVYHLLRAGDSPPKRGILSLFQQIAHRVYWMSLDEDGLGTKMKTLLNFSFRITHQPPAFPLNNG